MPISNPLVSFIIPYFNAGETIQETIDSIFNQTYQKFDVWIVNDGSTDPLSIEKLQDFEGNERIHILHQENAGPSVAKNIGTANSKGQLICFVDADNILLDDYINDAVNAFIENPSIDVVYSDFEFFGDRSGIHKSKKIDSFTIFIGNSVDNCVVIRKETFFYVNGFDAYLSKLGLEDWELWINLLKNKKKFFYIEKVHFKYRVIANSRTNTSANLNIEKIRKYIANKHSDFLSEIYKETYYKNKMNVESIDFKIGKKLLIPYRFLKSIFLKLR
jgi:glycosyltransferase involved in cell wall biosynthesis